MDVKDMEDVLKAKMYELEESKLQLAELRQAVKNNLKRLVMLAQQYPDIAKKVGAPAELPKRGNKDED
jgi:hypothetical protein